MYKITLHKKVLSEDLEGLDKADVEKIFKAVKEKLGTDPVHFGKPLREELKGYYRLRVDFYRVVYQVKKQEVTVDGNEKGLAKHYQTRKIAFCLNFIMSLAHMRDNLQQKKADKMKKSLEQEKKESDAAAQKALDEMN